MRSAGFYSLLVPTLQRGNENEKVTIMQRDIKTINLFSAPDSRFVVFSDAHRGDGTGADSLPPIP
ncbi:MAG: hypothetical protein CO013_13530 [Syntrophobacterales bacterium CG_4_8_14_3_um_filter_58_8]|nr:MAG: hypothetical protein COS57_02695 [Syntrophobacterales bacterium CG03_land_8_20_14_0_80_58_14]PJC71643.1 MAG: hypothetical protein CO013_13530 [Syntrophobacterales bacterium CG_4_8_14_3_um_filter_58_8]